MENRKLINLVFRHTLWVMRCRKGFRNLTRVGSKPEGVNKNTRKSSNMKSKRLPNRPLGLPRSTLGLPKSILGVNLGTGRYHIPIRDRFLHMLGGFGVRKERQNRQKVEPKSKLKMKACCVSVWRVIFECFSFENGAVVEHY